MTQYSDRHGPECLRIRGTVAPGRGETRATYARFGRRLAADACRVRAHHDVLNDLQHRQEALSGSTAHVLAIDRALRPVLSPLGAAHVVPGWFTLDRDIAGQAGAALLAPAAATALEQVTDRFSAAPGGRTDALAATG
ncbi:NAD(P)H-dependent FMN reductase [Streptomyces sp. 3330]|nr:NAD(P)H-dependent FMN reductase [Streptomyces sp. 3330]